MTDTRYCPECGKAFTPKQKHQKFCSPTHRNTHWCRGNKYHKLDKDKEILRQAGIYMEEE